MDRVPEQDGATGPALPSVLGELRILLDEAWPETYPPRRVVVSLLDRLVSARFHLAVLGQFKRGKSTFINALLGERILPSAAVPLTAVATYVAWGAAPSIRVSLQTGTTETLTLSSIEAMQDLLSGLVTEAGNPLNRRGIARVDVLLPNELLRSGLVLIDTPGIGSTLRHNTEAALDTLPECDAALFVVSADPPITEAEVAYLARVREHVVRLCVVLNKVDYLSSSELGDVERFLRTVLMQSGLPAGTPVFPLSARRALETSIGLADVRHWIVHDLAREQAESLRWSIGRKALATADQAMMDLSLRRRALEMPLGDLEQRAAAFSRQVEAIRTEQQTAADLLAGDHSRIAAALEAKAEQIRRAAYAELGAVVSQALGAGSGNLDVAQERLTAAIPQTFERHFTAARAAFRDALERRLAAHQARADALVGSVREIAAHLFELSLTLAAETNPIRLGPDPYWVTEETPATLIGSQARLLAGLLPRAVSQRRRRLELDERLHTLVRRNVENMRWAMLRSLDDSVRAFALHLQESLTETLAATEGAILQTLERRRKKTNETANELQQISELCGRLSDLHLQLTTAAKPIGVI